MGDAPVTVLSAAMADAQRQTTVLEALATRLDRDPDGPYLDFEGVAFTAREMDAASGSRTRLRHSVWAEATAWPRCSTTVRSRSSRSSPR
jgi:hypothetical protein